MMWIAIDWGTSNLRAYLMNGANIENVRHSDKGMAGLPPSEFEAEMLCLIDDWLEPRTEIWISGMAGARGGWTEVPYRPAPCKPSQLSLQSVQTSDPRLDVKIVPGVSQLAPHPDVMRGEETQIAGLMVREKNFDGVICLPGTHTKWAHISADEIVSFQTFMTGELHNMFSNSAILSPALEGQGWDDETFDAAVSTVISRPESLAARLFSLRADFLLNGTDGHVARSKLSGLLIGSEIAAAKPYWLGQRVVLVGNPSLTKHYKAALLAQGVVAQEYDAQDLTPLGLWSLKANVSEGEQ